MNNAAFQLQNLLEPTITALGYEFVGLELLGQGHRELIRIYIDRPGGVGLDDCARVSIQISGILEVEDPIRGPYTLEVSSPGLTRPLFGIRDFRRFIGHNVLIRLTPDASASAGQLHKRRKIIGVLQAADDKQIIVREAGQELTIPLERVSKANLHVEHQSPPR